MSRQLKLIINYLNWWRHFRRFGGLLLKKKRKKKKKECAGMFLDEHFFIFNMCVWCLLMKSCIFTVNVRICEQRQQNWDSFGFWLNSHLKSCWENGLAGIKVNSGIIKMFTQPNKRFLYQRSGSASIADFGLLVFILICSQDHVWKDKVLQKSPKYWVLVQSWADAAETSKRNSEQMWQTHPEVIRLFLNNISGCFLTHSKS